MPNKHRISLVLRIAVAFAFLYPPIAAFFNPDGWVWFVPTFVATVMPLTVFLHLFGVGEIMIALGILFMKNPFYPALAAAGVLAGIVIVDTVMEGSFDWAMFDVVFRDISILLAAVALMLLHQKPKGGTLPTPPPPSNE